ncbi:MAG: ferric reductase-like transmembrane domain-containing protein [Candidatus Staskawiczbacteria bacterium]|nr:ferric reductase-like transmembrane domain-containing protein [Candidatus Staskawiczbacteria bacterium]
MKSGITLQLKKQDRLVSKINWKYQFWQYGAAVTAAFVLFLFLSAYLFYRRGYYDLYIANKIFANVAAILLGIVLLIGPLSRIFAFPDRYVQYRKELGIVAFFLAIAHSVISYFFLPSKFSTQWFFGPGLYSFISGLIAAVILTAIFLISSDRVMNAIGREKWWRMQYIGARLVFILVFLHVFLMKWGGWVQWYKTGGGKELARPEWPGAGLLIGWFMVFVVLVRFGEFIGPKFGRATWYLSCVALLVVYIATFLWGMRFIG